MCLVIDKVIYSCLLSDRPTCSTSLTGLSVLLRNAIVIIFSRGDLQPSGIRRFGNGVSQLSPLRPVLGNGDFSTDWLSTDDLGQDVGERARK